MQLLDRLQQKLSLIVIRPNAFCEDEDDSLGAEDDFVTVLEETSDVWVNVANIQEFFPMHDMTVREARFHCAIKQTRSLT